MARFTGVALRVTQPIGEFWVASIPADVLLTSTVPDPLRLVLDPSLQDTNEWAKIVGRLGGNQRRLEQERLRAIAKYVDSFEATFPNSIILAVSSNASAGAWSLAAEAGVTATLTIPDDPDKAIVVDGQHRLYSFLRSEIEARKQFQLLCSVFFDIPPSMQAMIFATINTNQKQVRRALSLNLYGYNVEDESRERWSSEKLAVFVARRLNFDSGSRLYHRIKIEAENAPRPEFLPGAARAVSLAAVVDGVLALITTDARRDRDELKSERVWPRKDRTDLPSDDAPLREWYRTSGDQELYGLVREFIRIVDDCVWVNAPQGSMLTRAVGIRALLFWLRSWLGNQVPTPAASAGSDVSAVLTGVSGALTNASNIDFTNPFFEATGRGQQRILYALLVQSGLRSLESLGPSPDRDELEKLLSVAKSSPAGGSTPA